MQRRMNWIGTGIALAVILPLALLFSAGVTAGKRPASSSPPAAAGQVRAPADGVVDVELGDLYIKPSKIDVEPGQTVTFRVKNAGAGMHDFKLNGTTGTRMLEPGESETVKLGPFDAPSQIWCTMPGHKAAGMVMDVNVKGAAVAAQGVDARTPAENNFAKIDPNKNPGPEWKPFDPTLKPAEGGTVHNVTIVASEKQIEVAPGVMQEMWTFNGQVPGPVLRGEVGDVFNITLKNEGTMGHSIDLHASKVAWNDEMRTINPGESLTYQFEAKFAGAFMYHCGTAPALHHIGNGMFGAIIIDPPNLAPVDHEFIFMQHELYLGEPGGPGDLFKMQDEQEDAVVFNGYYNQYKFAPIRVEPNQRIRAWVVDDGPNENSSFHIVGTVFDTMFKEGAYTLQPDANHGGAQALDLQPAQGGFVEFSFDEPGLYLMVTHKFANVGKGALGIFQAGEVAVEGMAGH
ncbi:MAG: multicopper oxidase domain-containing protein [Hyphomicrobiales bacterium]